MIGLNDFTSHPGLLVSVRSAAEAITALAGGANIIDVKEPKRGSLGAADESTIREVVTAVHDRVPVTIAMGELIDATHGAGHVTIRQIPEGVSLFKMGLAGCADLPDWQQRWRQAIASSVAGGQATRPVAVVYADWQAASAPHPWDVLSAAVDIACPALLVDTWDKSKGTLFDVWTPSELREFVNEVRSRGLAVVLAGSLAGPAVSLAASMGPDLVAVRSAACDHGRCGTVSGDCVRAVRQLMVMGQSEPNRRNEQAECIANVANGAITPIGLGS